jgi:hypothetical protein
MAGLSLGHDPRITHLGLLGRERGERTRRHAAGSRSGLERARQVTDGLPSPCGQIRDGDAEAEPDRLATAPFSGSVSVTNSPGGR